MNSAVNPKQGESRSYRLRLIAIFLLPLLLLLLFWLWSRRSWHYPDEIVIAGGSPGGTYEPLSRGVAEILARELSSVSARAVHSKGSADNLHRLQEQQVLFGFVQNDGPGDSELRTVARLYSEVLQIVVAAGADIETLEDLRERRINVGPVNSGTMRLAQGVLEHYGITHYQPFHEEAAQAAEDLRTGKIDVAFFLAGLRTPVIEELLNQGDGQLLPIAETKSSLRGLAFGLPGVEATTIPAHIYGRAPSHPLGTLSVDALLVTRRDAPASLIREVTRLLFENRFHLIAFHSAADGMSELTTARQLRFPLHPGAANYYARNEPPFLVVYAEALSLGVTILVSVGSAALAVREWQRRRKKNRIDVYYLKAEESAMDLQEANRGQLLDLRKKLIRLRSQAFTDLVAERLEAGQAFAIFQSSIGQRLLEISQEMALRPSGGDSGSDSGAQPAS